MTDPIDEMARVLTATLNANALRLTTVRGGYVGGGQPHPSLASDPGAVEAIARGLLARQVAEPSRPAPTPVGPPVDDLGAAWAEAEAALPDDWWFEAYQAGHKEGDINPHTGIVLGPQPGPFVASAQPAWYPLERDGPPPGPLEVVVSGPTPAAALRALAARLAATKAGSS